jgi:hypothetical protein
MVGLDCFDAPVLGYRVMGRGVGAAARSRARPSGPLRCYVLLLEKREYINRILPYRFVVLKCKVNSQFFVFSFGKNFERASHIRGNFLSKNDKNRGFRDAECLF